MRSSVQNQIAKGITYVMLVLGSVVFIMPFLWMVSGSFKDLETFFEYPPSLLPMETQTIERNGRHYKLAELKETVKGLGRVVILDQRPGEYLVEGTGDRGQETDDARNTQHPTRSWVPSRDVHVLRRVHFWTENYPRAWTAKPFNRFALNTLIITLSCILGQVLSASLVAFAFARLEWPGRNFLFLVVLATMMLPAEVTLIPNYLIFRELGWIDTFLPLIVPAFLGGGAFFIFLFRQFFMTIPRELDEAARVDGCSSFGIYRHILMPLCRPIIATIAVLSFVNSWNDFLNPIIYLNSSDNYTLAIGLRFFQGAYTTDLHLLMAASTLVLIPVILVFFLGQRHFVKSIVLSGTKG